MTQNHFISVTVTDTDGVSGHGFSWTPNIGARAIQAMIEDDIAPFVNGQPAEPNLVWEPLWSHLHEAGGGGLTTIAIAGLDLALWDLTSGRHGVSVATHIGVRQRTLPVYASGINRHLPLADLVAQALRWVDAGYSAMKIKVGGRPLIEDVERVAAVREAIGASRDLMVDANQLWSLEEALAAASELEAFRPRWLEEPLRADDLESYRQLAAATSIPLAAGENIHTLYRFREFLDAGVLSIVQPNLIRVGGITPFLRIAHEARERGAQVFPHLLPELSGQVAMCMSPAPLLEDVEDSSLDALGILAGTAPIKINGPSAELVDHIGLGLRLRD